MAKQQEYGGPWTEVKLERVRQYCDAFLKEMEGAAYKTVYIDACCGRGIVKKPQPKKPSGGFKIPEPEPYIEGSPMQVLRLEQEFTRYYFNDKSRECCRKLTKIIKSEFPKRVKRTKVVCEDVNTFLVDCCTSTNWKNRRAVIFVDPFRPIVEWKTIEAIADTQAADLLYMFPVGIAVARMMKRSGAIGKKAKTTLKRLFGTKRWYDELYATFEKQGLLGSVEVTRRQTGCDAIIKYFVGRLESIFSHVARPFPLQNKTGLSMYALCFASPSEERTEIARKLFQQAGLVEGLSFPRVNKRGKRQNK